MSTHIASRDRGTLIGILVSVGDWSRWIESVAMAMPISVHDAAMARIGRWKLSPVRPRARSY